MATNREFADRLMHGKLDETLAEWRDKDVTFDEMSQRLQQQLGVKISRETLRRWSASPKSEEEVAS